LLLPSYEESMYFDRVEAAIDALSSFEPEDLFLRSRDVELFADGTVALEWRLTYMTPGAWRQLLRLAGIEVRASEVGREDLAGWLPSVNAWLCQSDRELLFRMSSGIVTAVLTEVYCPVANLDVLHSLAEVGVDECRVAVRGGWLWASVIEKNFAFEPQVGDIIRGGWDLSHNDRGQGALHMAHFLFRLTCTNGAVVKEAGSFSFTHRLQDKEFLTGVIKEKAGRLAAKKEKISRALTEMTKIDLGVRRAQMLRSVAKRLLGEKVFREFEDHIRADTNCYDAYNYITQLARNYGMDIRRDLEVLGGNLVAEFLRRQG